MTERFKGKIIESAAANSGKFEVIIDGYPAPKAVFDTRIEATAYMRGFALGFATGGGIKNIVDGLPSHLTYASNTLQLQSLNFAGGSTLLGMTYNYSQNGGNNGQITGVTDSVDSGRSTVYTFDALGRISTAVTTGSTNYPKWGLSWTYDRYGNRTNQTVTAGTADSNSVVVNAATNKITTAGYSYDANGNLTNDGLNSLTYDAENRLVSSVDGTGSGTYSYRASGLRAVKVSGGITTVYLFDGDRDIAEYTNGSLANEYVYWRGQLLANHIGGTLYYPVADRESSRVILDSSGNVAGQKGQYPFGEDWYSSTLTNRHFTSYERDSESSNDNALHRFFVNRLGRFSSTDQVPGGGGNPQGFDLYNYVDNDPVNKIDPDGRELIYPCRVGQIYGCGLVCNGDVDTGCGVGGPPCDPDYDNCGAGGGGCYVGGVEGQPCPPEEPGIGPPASPRTCDQPVLNSPPLKTKCSFAENGNVAKAILQNATGGPVDPGIAIDWSNTYADSEYLVLDGRPHGYPTTASPYAVFQNFHASNGLSWGGDINWSIAVTCNGKEVKARITGVTTVTCVH